MNCRVADALNPYQCHQWGGKEIDGFMDFFQGVLGLWEWLDHGEVVKNVTGSCQGVADVFSEPWSV